MKNMGNLDPRKMKKMMKQMGMETEEIEAEEVIIVKEDEEIHIKSPDVNKIDMMGQETFQITGEEEVEKREMEIPDEDIDMVVQKADVSEEKAEKALRDNDGDIAKAIKDLQ